MMEHSQKTVTKIPIHNLWSEKEGLNLFREKYLNKNNITEILESDSVNLVIADVGKELKWVTTGDNFKFYKEEISSHIIENFDKIDLTLLPGGYGYIASHWTGGTADIILLEKYH